MRSPSMLTSKRPRVAAIVHAASISGRRRDNAVACRNSSTSARRRLRPLHRIHLCCAALLGMKKGVGKSTAL